MKPLTSFLFLKYFFVALLLLTCSSKEPLQKQPNDIDELKKALSTLEKDEVLKNGTLSFCLRKAKNSEVVYSLNDQKSLNMASNMKLITTASALSILGDDYTFKTYLQYDGTIENGILKGNIYIKGTGDPTLGSYQMQATPNFDQLLAQWTSQIQKAGITKIEGKIIADASEWDNNAIPSGWIWGDIGNYYGAAAMALNIADNTYQLYLQPASQIGGQVQVVKTFPQINNLTFINNITTAAAGTGDNAYIDGSPYTHLRFLHGTIPQGGTFTIKGAIPDPALLIAEGLFQQLKNKSIPSSDFTTSLTMKANEEKMNTKRQTIYTHYSPKLSVIASWVNLFSVNLYAEALYKAVGKALVSEKNKETPTDAIKTFWQHKGLAWEGLRMLDGSGLSQGNGVLTNQMTKMLALMTLEKNFDTFYNTLPVAGVSGTMAYMGKGTVLANNLRAKTGWMTDAVAFSGYFKTPAGELMCFSICANRFDADYSTMKKKIEKVLLAMM